MNREGSFNYSPNNMHVKARPLGDYPINMHVITRPLHVSNSSSSMHIINRPSVIILAACVMTVIHILEDVY